MGPNPDKMELHLLNGVSSVGREIDYHNKILEINLR
jgi:hypothetical protein